MCGFAAMVALKAEIVSPDVVKSMTDTIKHRGPDDEGFYVNGHIALGFRRLSILDLTPSGHQPMLSADGNKVIVFNGEIFNYIELRKELEVLGWQFRSTSDTEVLLNAYIQWGRKCLEKLNGMWAFLIYDSQSRILFGSRDRFGIKPLYKYRSEKHLLFCSEIKGILSSGFYNGQQNLAVVSDFFLTGKMDDSNNTFFSKIDKIPAGSAFELDYNGKYQEWKYWSLSSISCDAPEEPVSLFRELFEDSVKIRLRSDVPVGVCLSGGLDSTSIICAMKRNRSNEIADNPIQAFCYMDEIFDESIYIQDTLNQTNAHLNRLETNPINLWDNLHKVLWYHDEPLHSMTVLVGFELFRLAAESGVKVVLNGQGADEVIAGYRTYFRDYWYSLFRSGDVVKAWKEINEFCQHHGGTTQTQFLKELEHFFRYELGRFDFYRSLASRRQYRILSKDSWFTPELLSYHKNNNKEYIENTLSTSLMRSVESTPLPLYLKVEDRNSMAHSVEARVPFMDYRLVSAVFSMKDDYKIRGHWNKYVLRASMKGNISESVRMRIDKMGFPTPVKNWTNDLYEPFQDILNSQEASQCGLFNIDNIIKDYKLQKHGKKNVALKLFHVVEFLIWNRMVKIKS